MPYIEDLRRLISHRLLILVGAAVLITDTNGRLLLGQRSDNLAWGIPGGALEPGETLEAAARRETLEETGQLLQNSEHISWRFVEPDCLPENISPPVRPVLRAWLEHGRADPNENSP